MVFQPNTYSVLVVASSKKFHEALGEILPVTDYYPVERAFSAAEARRITLDRSFDIVLISSPLSDESGTTLAEDLCASSETAVLMLSPGEIYEELHYKLLPSGVATAPKPTSSRLMAYSLRLLAAMRERLRKTGEKRRSVEDKIEEIRLVNRAKWALIEKKGMTEAEAQHYIERLSMDRRISKSAAAQFILNSNS